jgi:hypothetical protein
MRQMYVKSRCELFVLVCAVLGDKFPEWRADVTLICGLCCADIVGLQTMVSGKEADKKETQELLNEILPLAKEVLAARTTLFLGGRVN